MMLKVKQMNQWDSATDEGQRMCGSSTMAMLVHFLAPGLITQAQISAAGYSQLDDYWLKVLIEGRGRNTNDPYAHLAALQRLGFHAELRTNCNFADVDAQLAAGIPVPMPINHHGPAGSPDKGRWHWILCCGKASFAHDYNDPYGELDVANGGYRMGNGGGQRYSDKNLRPRWESDGPGQGWAMMVRPPFPKAKK